MEDGNSLDSNRVKAIFYTLYFGGEAADVQVFLDCFVAQADAVPVPIEDMNAVWANIAALSGAEMTDELKFNAENVYSLVKNGYPNMGEGNSFEMRVNGQRTNPRYYLP